jgi:hypothetical protein
MAVFAIVRRADCSVTPVASSDLYARTVRILPGGIEGDPGIGIRKDIGFLDLKYGRDGTSCGFIGGARSATARHRAIGSPSGAVK